MVGLPRKYLPLVQCIREQYTLIFIFNFSDRHLHGVYLASSNGMEHISRTAFQSSAPPGAAKEPLDGSPFPAQVTFEVTEEFAPCPEAEFKHVLEYTERRRFKFKLSEWQCRDLVEALCRHDAKLRAKRLCEELGLSTTEPGPAPPPAANR